MAAFSRVLKRSLKQQLGSRLFFFTLPSAHLLVVCGPPSLRGSTGYRFKRAFTVSRVAGLFIFGHYGWDMTIQMQATVHKDGHDAAGSFMQGVCIMYMVKHNLSPG